MLKMKELCGISTLRAVVYISVITMLFAKKVHSTWEHTHSSWLFDRLIGALRTCPIYLSGNSELQALPAWVFAEVAVLIVVTYNEIVLVGDMLQFQRLEGIFVKEACPYGRDHLCHRYNARYDTEQTFSLQVYTLMNENVRSTLKSYINM